MPKTDDLFVCMFCNLHPCECGHVKKVASRIAKPKRTQATSQDILDVPVDLGPTHQDGSKTFAEVKPLESPTAKVNQLEDDERVHLRALQAFVDSTLLDPAQRKELKLYIDSRASAERRNAKEKAKEWRNRNNGPRGNR